MPRSRLTVREQLERLVNIVLAQAIFRAWSPRRIRRELRVRGTELRKELGCGSSDSSWYRAVRKVAGMGVREMRDTRQQEMFR